MAAKRRKVRRSSFPFLPRERPAWLMSSSGGCYLVRARGEQLVAVYFTTGAFEIPVAFTERVSMTWNPVAGNAKEEIRCMAIQKRQAREQQAASSGVMHGEFGDKHPNLFDYLSLEVYADGSPRTVSTLNVFCENGLWKGGLHDRDAEQTLWQSAETFEDLCCGIELALEEGSQAHWRPWKSRTRQGTQKRK